MLSGKMLRFALDNTRFPMSAVVAEFLRMSMPLQQKRTAAPPSFFSLLFGTI